MHRAALSGLLYSRAALPEAVALSPSSEGFEPAPRQATSLGRLITAMFEQGIIGHAQHTGHVFRMMRKTGAPAVFPA